MTDRPLLPPPTALQYWRGLGFWNYYFLTKFVLVWQGLLNFHPLENLAFAAFLLLPLPPLWLHRLRHAVAIPIGISLYLYDTWLPPVRRLFAQSAELSEFSFDYLLELAGRFINTSWLAAGLVLLVGYLFFSQWIRFTAVTVIALVAIMIGSQTQFWRSAGHESEPTMASVPAPAIQPSSQPGQASSVPRSVAGGTIEATDANLNAALNDFYTHQGSLVSQFPATLANNAAPFDVLILNVCSMAWDDLEDVGLTQHPLWNKMDVLFDDFNSAATYSGPAVLRLLRASCGQPANAALYQPVSQQCFLFENLKKLGFDEALVMNHTGRFDNMIGQIKENGNMQAPLFPLGDMRPVMTGFDGSPIYRDGQVLSNWWQQRLNDAAPREAMFYNTISLHDGNRIVDAASGKTVTADYKPRLQNVLDDLSSFIDRLQASGRPVLLVIVSEHGAALRGDLMQIKGMREIPSPTVTQIPAGIKLINAKAKLNETPVHIRTPTSYFALSELINHLVSGAAWKDPNFDLNALITSLPKLDHVVAENEGSVMMRFNDTHYLRLDGKSWIKYPERGK
jgi:cellulose synthase operon protein YhjU